MIKVSRCDDHVTFGHPFLTFQPPGPFEYHVTMHMSSSIWFSHDTLRTTQVISSSAEPNGRQQPLWVLARTLKMSKHLAVKIPLNLERYEYICLTD